MLLTALLFVVLLFLSAFFSASETAVFSLDLVKRTRMFRSGRRSALRLKRLFDTPVDLLMSILIGNMFVNIALSSVAADFFGEERIFAVVVTTLVLLIFGEITPKNLAYAFNRKMALVNSLPLSFFCLLFHPIRKLLNFLTYPVIRRFQGQGGEEAVVTRDEIRTAVVSGHRQGVLGSDERDLISNVLNFSMKVARHIMTPRTEIHALSHRATLEEAIALSRNTGVSKVPVYKKNKDHIVGYIRTKDMLPYICGLRKASGISHLVREVFYIPEGRGLAEFFPEMQQSTSRMAVVLDEYGGTAGIITLDDILEEVLGQFLDEDEKQEQVFRRRAGGVVEFLGLAPLSDFNQAMGMEISSGDYETLSGYLLELAGDIPQEGSEYSDGEYSYRVIKMEENRILKIEVRPL